MVPLLRRWVFYTAAAASLLFTLLQIKSIFGGLHDESVYNSITGSHYHGIHRHSPDHRLEQIRRLTQHTWFRPTFKWKDVPEQYPVENLTHLPTGPPSHIPKIQYDFEAETYEQRIKRQARLAVVKEAFLHSWDGYKTNAWLQDEVAPLTGKVHNGFGGWGATLVDSLDTMYIMGLEKEFATAVAELKKIDFTTTPLDEVNVFETTIRYIGGFLSAYDISGQQHGILLEKAIELGEMLYHAFDTPNRMPVTRWDWKNKALGGEQEAARFSLVAEVGSLTLEFTRLSQLTGDHKWYDAIARVTNVFEEQQNLTKIPGLFPTTVDTKNADFTKDIIFTFGGMADSLYEYFPKQHLMLGGRSKQYRNLYLTALESAKEHILFRALNPDNQKLLVLGTLKRLSSYRQELIPQGEHLTCFAGGMIALAAKAFRQTQDLEVARQLLDGCLWAYESMPSGIMPETFFAAPCKDSTDDEALNCSWSETKWHNAVAKHLNKGNTALDLATDQAQTHIRDSKLAPGFVEIVDSRYNLRPEAIESLFVLYRITGDRTLQEKAWKMFGVINHVAKTKIAYAGIEDVTATPPKLLDTMESFWTAETLKYFYLIFSEPDVISLDDYVL